MPFVLALDDNNQGLMEVDVLDGASTDSFGRLRVSNPETIFDLTHLYDKQAIFVNELVASGGSSTHLPNEATVQMNVTNTAGSRIVRQTRRYFSYQPAKSFLIYMSGVLSTTVNTGITSRIGLFDNHADKTVDVGGNGFFFQYSGGVVSIVKRSYITGAQVDTVVNQADWNLDKLDGTGKSGITFDVTKVQIFWINAQWLGVGSVKMGVVINGKYITVHQFDHANILGGVYTTRISLPIRYELQRNSAAGAMKMICCSVISEGGHNPQGRSFSRALTNQFSVNAEVVILAIRLKSEYNRATFIPKLVDILETSNDSLLYRVYVGCTLTGAVWVDNHTGGSAVEYDISATGISGGRVIASGYVSTSNRAANVIVDSVEGIAAEINGTQDIVAITIQSLSGAASAAAALSWVEVL